jgi:hypothetical protein
MRPLRRVIGFRFQNVPSTASHHKIYRWNTHRQSSSELQGRQVRQWRIILSPSAWRSAQLQGMQAQCDARQLEGTEDSDSAKVSAASLTSRRFNWRSLSPVPAARTIATITKPRARRRRYVTKDAMTVVIHTSGHRCQPHLGLAPSPQKAGDIAIHQQTHSVGL